MLKQIIYTLNYNKYKYKTVENKNTHTYIYTLCSKLLCKSRFSRYFEKYFSKTNKTFQAIAFYYDQPLVLIWTKFDKELFGYDVYAKKVPFPLFQIIMQNVKVPMKRKLSLSYLKELLK